MLTKFGLYLCRFTIRRLWNLILAEIQYRLRCSHLYNYPVEITVEPGNMCNLRCALCPTGQRDTGAAHGFIEFRDFKRIVDEIGDYLILIRLYNWGEPLLHHDLKKMIEYATKKGIDVKISTNLNITLSDKEAEAIINANLRKIYISANGASKETYAEYHIGGDFNRVISNMKLLVAKKRELKNRYTEIIWLFHVFSHNEHEIERAKAMAKKIDIRLTINKMRTDMGKEIFETAEKAVKRDGKWLPKNPEYNIFDLENKMPKKRFKCNLLWKETVINWDGSVLPCCSVYSERFSFGNIHDRSFKEIWNNEMYVSARKVVKSGKKDYPYREILSLPNSTICHICKSNGFPFNQ